MGIKIILKGERERRGVEYNSSFIDDYERFGRQDSKVFEAEFL